jgi:hypothetical protein
MEKAQDHLRIRGVFRHAVVHTGIIHRRKTIIAGVIRYNLEQGTIFGPSWQNNAYWKLVCCAATLE